MMSQQKQDERAVQEAPAAANDRHAQKLSPQEAAQVAHRARENIREINAQLRKMGIGVHLFERAFKESK